MSQESTKMLIFDFWMVTEPAGNDFWKRMRPSSISISFVTNISLFTGFECLLEDVHFESYWKEKCMNWLELPQLKPTMIKNGRGRRRSFNIEVYLEASPISMFDWALHTPLQCLSWDKLLPNLQYLLCFVVQTQKFAIN